VKQVIRGKVGREGCNLAFSPLQVGAKTFVEHL